MVTLSSSKKEKQDISTDSVQNAAKESEINVN